MPDLASVSQHQIITALPSLSPSQAADRRTDRDDDTIRSAPSGVGGGQQEARVLSPVVWLSRRAETSVVSGGCFVFVRPTRQRPLFVPLFNRQLGWMTHKEGTASFPHRLTRGPRAQSQHRPFCSPLYPCLARASVGNKAAEQSGGSRSLRRWWSRDIRSHKSRTTADARRVLDGGRGCHLAASVRNSGRIDWVTYPPTGACQNIDSS